MTLPIVACLWALQLPALQMFMMGSVCTYRPLSAATLVVGPGHVSVRGWMETRSRFAASCCSSRNASLKALCSGKLLVCERGF
jgi:hypothetical protein